MKYLYDDDEEIWDYYDEDPNDMYPQVIIEVNEEKLLEHYDEVKKRTQK